MLQEFGEQLPLQAYMEYLFYKNITQSAFDFKGDSCGMFEALSQNHIHSDCFYQQGFQLYSLEAIEVNLLITCSLKYTQGQQNLWGGNAWLHPNIANHGLMKRALFALGLGLLICFR